jgi:hypothetical protein
MPIPDWRSGTPSIGEWSGAWRASDSENEVTHQEWLDAWASLDKWLAHTGRNGFGHSDDFFLQSVWFAEHRSLVVELVRPSVLTLGFLRHLQRWIIECYPTWRIIVPLFLGEKNVITIYRNTIRGSPDIDRGCEAALEQTRLQMMELPQFKHPSSHST